MSSPTSEPATGSTESSTSTSKTKFRGLWDRLTSSAEEEDAAKLRDTSEMLGLVSAENCCDRQRVTVHGSVKSVTMLPRAGAPSLEAELFDGTGTIALVWLGRRRIHGIECGRTLSASGLVSISGDRRVIYNPRYELDPARSTS